MKTAFFVIFSILFCFLSIDNSFAQNKKEVTRFQSGDRGIFEYPWLDNEFVVWRSSNETAGKYGIVAGIITSQTKVVVKNKKIQKEDLSILSGKEVVVMGKFREEGSGEGSKTYCEELTILVIDGRER